MADRISSPDDNVKEEKKDIPQTTPIYDCAPEGYINPFDNKEDLAVDSYPYVFSDVDFELKRNPHLFKGFNIMKVDLHSESKSENARIWQHTRWKTWKYLYGLPRLTAIIEREDTDPEGARSTVSINGVTFYITKGVYVDVPSDIRQVIMDSQSQTLAAGQQSLLASLAKKLDPVTGLPKDQTRLER